MKSESFTRHSLNDNLYTIEQVIKTTHTLIPLEGQAIITHVGGNSRFKFNIDGKVYTSEFQKKVCTTYEPNKYYDYSNVKFNINIDEEWSKLYNRSSSEEYWKTI